MHTATITRPTIHKSNLRNEALLILDKRGNILDMAREVSRLMRDADVDGVVIGGVAVVLHGHVRTTKDVDIFITSKLESLADLLTTNDFTFDKTERAFIKQGIAVHLVQPEQVGTLPKETVEIDGITTVSLVDLINIKLRSGSENLLRAQDLADVIGLIRHHQLTNDFAKQIEKPLRSAFRKLVRMIERENKKR
jgi:hypothetical protein